MKHPDDALDYSSTNDALGKDIGDDFYEGKITFPVIAAYRKSSAIEKKVWEELHNKVDKDHDDFNTVLELLDSKNAINITLDEAKKYGQKAIDALQVFPKSDIRDALIEGAHFSYSRKS